MTRHCGGALAGVCVLVTRPAHQAVGLVERLSVLGAEVMVHPVIQILEPGDWTEVDRIIDRLGQFDWIVFSSVNGAHHFWGRVAKLKGEVSKPSGVKLAAIGPGTADELRVRGLQVDLVPPKYRAESLADALAETGDRRFLLCRASRGREVLAEKLLEAGAAVEQVVTYSSTDVQRADPSVVTMLDEGRIHWVTVTSSAIAAGLVNLFGSRLKRCCLASISPITSATLRESGFEPAVEAEEYTMAGLVEAIAKGVSA